MSGPQGGPAGYRHIWKANTDGTGRTLLYDFEDDVNFVDIGGPAWAPDTAIVAFHEGTLDVVCNPDEEECANYYPETLYTTSANSYWPHFAPPGGPATHGGAPNWSPDGTKLAFFTPDQGLPGFRREEIGGRIGFLNRDGSGRQLLTPGLTGTNRFDEQPAWSPRGTRIVFQRNGDGVHVINADGTGDTRVSSTGFDPDWQPLPVNTASTYIRPKEARVIRVPLVPAFQPCTAPNRTHGPPLEQPSCNPARPRSVNLKISVGETRLRSTGALRMAVTAGAPGTPDDTDVQLSFGLTNVMRSDDSEYSGELRVQIGSRLTDREGSTASSTREFRLSWDVPCTPTADPDYASSCALDTTLDAVLPGAAPEGTRAVWRVGQVGV